MKRFLFPLILSPLMLGVVALSPAAASPLVRQVSESQAQGLGNTPAVVSVWAGSGTNIDFTRTGEVIQRVWLDDPSFITVDFDGSLASASLGGGGGSGNSGASVIHLRRITGLRFPFLPQTRSTLLTVITTSTAGQKTHLFQIHYGSGSPQYSSIAVVPDRGTDANSDRIIISGGRSASIEDVERGLNLAVSQRLIAATSPVVLRVQTLIASVRNGISLTQATSQTGLPLAAVTRLAEMGYRPTASSMLTPVSLPSSLIR